MYLLTLVDLADVSEVGVAVKVVPEAAVLVHVDAVLLGGDSIEKMKYQLTFQLSFQLSFLVLCSTKNSF